ncbi:serine-type D-Ala-D-Ala carboxypeptidase [Vibrio diabolicus]|uniref:Serine-type D-Ala-D-Ala carboxypeptidase n=1 Tax=Vibrio diabolicus TaxID=50719 RepID=A0AAX1XM26_9VIBR|nr:serine-type D-Ala-D-Ala carboxypeptidase [Vibrio diabolicus]MCS0349633.1 serine-type D-Ala-D-Ala carboxypeptidase [Vibrio diabolicus]MCS0360002.1 serine-type D-Ala-D-Ala carboxypeptidase [Vibrio diabolicus]MCS0372725.1 serine-type D-Ala-D-Ala carboxypeptidase [Vibrio diabolicus]MCS0424810.1 serine-type D-Ala-D-Ala carboxypeptidase [Vibrio diabolicus]MCS0439024.1 serine-type D-Ala-D-Ala carboxypeptidase [Vibrio diabolicus]
MRLRWPLLIFSSLLSAFSQAYPHQEVLPEGSRISLVAEKLSENAELDGVHPTEQLFPPASTLKIVTALAAKLELGDNFRFRTKLEASSSDAVIYFVGDPTLQTNDLKSLLTLAKKNGLKRIDGDLWLDNSAFTGYNRAVGWPWDILGVCYSAPASTITLNNNCVQASIYTQKDGGTRVYVPEHQPIRVTSTVETVSKTIKKSRHCDLGLVANPDNNYKLTGCLVEREKPLPLKFAVQDPELYTSHRLAALLKQLNIELSGKIRIGSAPEKQRKLIAMHQSEALPDILEEMLKNSDNLIADTLTKTLGAKFFVQSGSFANGTEAIKQIIFANTGIDIRNARLEDGSGLSRNNRISATEMAEILRYIWKHEDELKLIAIMPKSGESGTLKYRQSMRKLPIKGQLIAKSGSLYGTYNMAGYGLDKNGQPNTVFVQFVSDYFPEKRDDNKPVIAPITHFEQLFYSDIVNFSQAIPKK